MKVSAILAAATVLVNVAPTVMAAPLQSSAHAEIAFKREYAELLERHPQVLSQLIESASARGYSGEDAELIAREPIFGLFKTGINLVKGLFGGRRRELGEDYLEARDLFVEEYESRDFEDVYEYSARGAHSWDDMD